ncbi:hypothetical protein QUA81_20035 [Microcoleus sp. F6_B4]
MVELLGRDIGFGRSSLSIDYTGFLRNRTFGRSRASGCVVAAAKATCTEFYFASGKSGNSNVENNITTPNIPHNE